MSIPLKGGTPYPWFPFQTGKPLTPVTKKTFASPDAPKYLENLLEITEQVVPFLNHVRL